MPEQQRCLAGPDAHCSTRSVVRADWPEYVTDEQDLRRQEYAHSPHGLERNGRRAGAKVWRQELRKVILVKFATRLDAALALAEPNEFLRALAHIDDRYNGVAFEQRPEPLSLFGCAFAFCCAVDGEGIWKYLAESDGDGFYQLLKISRRIGAVRTTEYLEAVAMHYPRGRVPDDHAARYERVERLEAKAARTGTEDPLRILDRQYVDAIPELAARLRAWIDSNRDAVVSALEQLPAQDKPAPSLADALEGAATSLTAMADDAERADRAEQEIMRDAAVARGLLPWREPDDDPRSQRFLDAAARLSADEWMIVAARAAKRARRLNEATTVVWEVGQLVAKSDMVDGAAFRRAQMRVLKAPARVEVGNSLKTLPKQAKIDGRAVGVAANAHRAFAAATAALSLHDWLLLTPKGEDAARVAYELFEGFAPYPEISARRRIRARRSRS